MTGDHPIEDVSNKIPIMQWRSETYSYAY